MMHMSFWFGSNLGTFLFPGYEVNATWALIATCFGFGGLAVLYEGMKLLQIKLQRKSATKSSENTNKTSEDSTLLSKMASPALVDTRIFSPTCKYWYTWIFQVLHYFLHTTLAYILMMAVMSYNAYIAISLVVGAGLGYWIFGPTLVELHMEQMKSRERIIRCDEECADAIVESNTRRQSALCSVAEQLVAEAQVDVHAANNI